MVKWYAALSRERDSHSIKESKRTAGWPSCPLAFQRTTDHTAFKHSRTWPQPKPPATVKSRLQPYPQEADVWEADFQPIPDEKHAEFWLGMVVNQEVSVDLAHQVLNAPPHRQ